MDALRKAAKQAAKAAEPPQADHGATIALLQARVRKLEAQLARKPKATQAPPQPRNDDAKLAACQTANRNLRVKMKGLTAAFEATTAKLKAEAGRLRATRGLVMKIVHPDQRPRYLTPEDAARFDDACRRMNAVTDG